MGKRKLKAHLTILNDVDVVSSNIAYAVGFSGTVLKTSNAGINRTITGAPSASNINGLSFPAFGITATGWIASAGCYFFIFLSSQYIILKASKAFCSNGSFWIFDKSLCISSSISVISLSVLTLKACLIQPRIILS